MSPQDFTFHFSTSKKAKEIFPILLDVPQWWNGLLDEKLEGNSRKIGDVFTFTAGEGAHFSEQKLIGLVENEKIVWLITKSHLSFLNNTDEWKDTTIEFHLNQKENETEVTFIHKGLSPEIECYQSCSNAWMAYIRQLELLLN